MLRRDLGAGPQAGALRAGEVAQVSSEEILWAQRFAEAQPGEAAPVTPSNRRQKGR